MQSAMRMEKKGVFFLFVVLDVDYGCDRDGAGQKKKSKERGRGWKKKEMK
jgi:hypothetical protein